MREFTFGTLGDKVDLACRKVGDIRLIPTAEAVALLSFLAIQDEAQRVILTFTTKIDLHPVGLGHSETKLLGLDTDFVVINSESAREDDLVYSVQGRSTEAVLLGKGGQRGSC